MTRRKKITAYMPIPSILIFMLGFTQNGNSLTIDLAPYTDSVTVLENPHKGWYHHYYDNGIWRYMVKKDSDIEAFPGMSHLYIRLAWSFFEPKEGVYNWTYIDNLVSHWVPKGYGISICITAKETRGEGLAVPMGSAGYATPKWVADAGAKGTWVTNTNAGTVQNWEPIWDDPIFLQKLSNFHHALAARYDTASWLVDVVTGSIGDWGEGQTFYSTKIVPSAATVKKHLDIYRSAYTHAQLVANDDLLTYGKNTTDQNELRAYAVSKGFSFRDDSPLVNWYIKTYPSTFSVQNISFFNDVWKTRPTTLECEHYRKVVDSLDWVGPNGNVKGGAILRGAIRAAHATYVGYHHYADEWLAENPQLAKDLANFMGYWFFLRQINLPDSASSGKAINLSLHWRNHGAAVAYNPFQLQIQLSGATSSWTTMAPTANPRGWLPDSNVTENYSITLPANLPQDNYSVKVRLIEIIKGDTIPIKLALSSSLLDANGFYKLGQLPVKNANGSAIRRFPKLRPVIASESEKQKIWDLRGRTWTQDKNHPEASMILIQPSQTK
jgi:Domain of unknown function (DUF4832)/Beta-galactosidase